GAGAGPGAGPGAVPGAVPEEGAGAGPGAGPGAVPGAVPEEGAGAGPGAGPAAGPGSVPEEGAGAGAEAAEKGPSEEKDSGGEEIFVDDVEALVEEQLLAEKGSGAEDGDPGDSLEVMMDRRDAKYAGKTITMFREGKLQVVVTTDACSEGIDIPECNLVVSLDKIKTSRDLIHTRGRARRRGGRFIMMVEVSNRLR
ncbi:unnamed protein product, partial [Discosporangium mesarthrocarpum]